MQQNDVKLNQYDDILVQRNRYKMEFRWIIREMEIQMKIIFYWVLFMCVKFTSGLFRKETIYVIYNKPGGRFRFWKFLL
jgi:hypothetical protein